MERNLRNLVAGLALCAAATAIAPQSAHAYSVSGVAIGGDATLTGPSGLALTIGLDRLELDFIVGLGLNLPEGGVLEPGFAGAGGVYFTVADGEQTNFQIGGRLGVIVVGASSVGPFAELDTNAGLLVDVLARVEHRFDDHFTINVHVGMGMQIWPDDPDVGNGQPDFVWGFGNTGLIGGAGFRYWFDGLGGGAPVAAAPVAQPTATSTTTTTTTTTTPSETQESGSTTPYWEQ